MLLVLESLTLCAACAGRLESHVAYFRWAAEKGHAASLERIGAMYAEGRGVEADQSAGFLPRGTARARPSEAAKMVLLNF